MQVKCRSCVMALAIMRPGSAEERIKPQAMYLSPNFGFRIENAEILSFLNAKALPSCTSIELILLGVNELVHRRGIDREASIVGTYPSEFKDVIRITACLLSGGCQGGEPKSIRAHLPSRFGVRPSSNPLEVEVATAVNVGTRNGVRLPKMFWYLLPSPRMVFVVGVW